MLDSLSLEMYFPISVHFIRGEIEPSPMIAQQEIDYIESCYIDKSRVM